VDGRKKASTIEEVAPLPDNWTPTVHWYNVATDEDPDGWQYATDMTSMSWFNTPDTLRCQKSDREAYIIDINSFVVYGRCSEADDGA
jgi:hypothetical protein